MNYTLAQLKNLQPFDKVVIHSVGMGLYQASVEKNSVQYYLTDDAGRVKKATNIITLQKLFRRFNFQKMVLRHQSPYDEMIGHDGNKPLSNALEVPIGDNRLD